jgi:hypothetical protein
MKKRIFLSLLPFLALVTHAQTGKSSTTEQELIRLSNDWMVATMNRDEITLNKIVAPAFRLGGTNPGNADITREIWMKNTMENLKIDSINYLKIQVDLVDDLAIVRSTFYWSVAFRDMPAKKDTGNLVDIWIRKNKSWQVISRMVVD